MNNPPIKFDWDLSQSRSIKWRDRSTDQPAEQSWEGEIELKLTLPENRLLQEPLKFLAAQQQRGEITHLKLQTIDYSLDELLSKAKSLIKLLQLTETNLNHWYQEIKAERDDRTFQAIRNDLSPTVALKLQHSYQDTKPWYILIELGWGLPPRKPPRKF